MRQRKYSQFFLFIPSFDLLLNLVSPFHSIGLPYYRETLASALPNIFISDVGAPPPKFSQNDMAHLTKASFGLYGPNQRNAHRNQVEDTRSADKSSFPIRAPKFLSEKARDAGKSSLAGAVIEAQVDRAADALGTAELESLKPDVPALYQSVEIQFSKYGVDDFDFGYVCFPTPRSLSSKKLTAMQLLQPDPVCGPGKSHCQLLCKLPPSSSSLYTPRAKSRAPACRDRLP